MEFLIVVVSIIALGILNFLILPELKKRKILRKRDATKRRFDEYTRLYEEAKSAIASQDYETGIDKLCRSLYFPISPIDMSGLNTANADVYLLEISDKLQQLDKAINHDEVVLDELESLYNSKGVPVLLTEARHQLSVLTSNSRQAFKTQEQLVNLNYKLGFSAINAAAENMKVSEYENKFKSKIEACLKHFDKCCEACSYSYENLKQLLDGLPAL